MERKMMGLALLVRLAAGCSGDDSDIMLVPEEQFVRVIGEPCGATVDEGEDGVIDGRWTIERSADGRRTRETLVGSDGTLHVDSVREVDRANRPLLWDWINDQNGPNWRLRETYVYDNFGRLLQRATFDEDEYYARRQVETPMSWSPAGRVLTSTIENYLDDRTVEGDELQPWYSLTVTYAYDAVGRMISQQSTLGDGSLHYSKHTTYDDVARTRLIFTTNHTTNYRVERLSSYDERGHHVRERLTYLDIEDFPVWFTEYTWEGDRLISERTTGEGYPAEKVVYTFCP